MPAPLKAESSLAAWAAAEPTDDQENLGLLPNQQLRASTRNDQQRHKINARDLGEGADLEPLPKEHPDIAVRPQPQSNERYGQLIDNPFKSVAKGDDAATFAVDVDTASYSNLKRFVLKQEQLPPADAVRIEELINSFDYSYEALSDESEMPVAFRSTLTTCPWQDQHQLLRVALESEMIDPATRPPVNLVFLIDTSGQ